MTQSLLISLGTSLILTLVLETGFFLLIGKRGKKDLLLLVLVNVLTNPPVVLLYWLATWYTAWPTAIIILPLELFAVLTEGYYYKKYAGGFKHPYLFSLAANMFSFWSGMIIQLFV